MVLVDHLQITKKEYKNLKKQEIHDIFNENELDKAFGDFKDLTSRTASDKILSDKAFNVAKNLNVMDINADLFQWFIKF